MKISIIRGGFLNPFELQNYYPFSKKHNIQAISSLKPLNSQIKLPLKKLLSPTDLPYSPYLYPILNRLLKDAHHLFGLEAVIAGSDIAHVAETYYHYTLQAIKAKRKGLVKKVVSTVWEVIPFNNESLRGRQGIKAIARKEIDHFITHTELAKDTLVKEGVSAKKITTIPLGVNLNRFKPRNSNSKKTKDLTILFIGRLEESKGVQNLLQAFLKLNKTIPNLNLNLVGQGTLKEKITTHKNINLKTVPYNKIHQEYQKADIFCLPSQATSTWQEQYGMVLVEAMASGLPIITTDTGAIKEVCGSAAIYTTGSAQSIYQSLKDLILSPKKRAILKKNSRQRALSRYNCLHTSKKIEKIYKQQLK
jgi:alpha-maltose-1-phosphate synthase